MGQSVADALGELATIAGALEDFSKKIDKPKVKGHLDALQKRAESVGKSWSRSWIGYHANVYYEEFEPPPPGANFSSEWGFSSSFHDDTRGRWVQFDPDYVRALVRDGIDEDAEKLADSLRSEAAELLGDSKAALESIFEAVAAKTESAVAAKLRKEVADAKARTSAEVTGALRPNGFSTRDSIAGNQGLWTPPHIAVLSEVIAVRMTFAALVSVAKATRRAIAHYSRLKGGQQVMQQGNTIFIGHGRSLLWRELKDFLADKLNLEWSEFNRVPVAGVANSTRLSELLNGAAMAFLVMTAEDEQADAKYHPRMNVVHEAGLFQGRLGFTRAIILLEDDCEEFSNVQGLGQIRFPKGQIKACFTEVRDVLEREQLISS